MADKPPRRNKKALSLWPLKPDKALKKALTTPLPGREQQRKQPK